MSGLIDTVGSKSGFIGSDVYPAGHVINVTHKEDFTGVHDTTNDSFDDALLQASCTFTAGNKIWIVASIWGGGWSGGSDVGQYMKFYDETNGADIKPTELVVIYSNSQGGDEGLEGQWPFSHLYTPPSGTSITFGMYHYAHWGGTVRIDRRRSMITLLEIQS